MTSKTLDEWLDYQQHVHAVGIDLGLERVRAVWQRMGAPRPAPVAITVGGTNGKGSTVAFLEAMLAAAGKRVGCYTSPHLLRYNERVRVAGVDVDDGTLVDAFERIEAARCAAHGETVPLTYFEFGTLAALWIFAQSSLDVAVLEVGLGGRLDAINIVDADAMIVTTIDLDHQDWLGNDLDSIGREKAGIFRHGYPAIVGTENPPSGLLDEATRIGAQAIRAGRDFSVTNREDGWRWQSGTVVLDLPDPSLAAPCQRENAAAAIAVLYALRDRLGWAPAALADGVRNARALGRLQRFSFDNSPEWIVDVAHNPQAARMLASWLALHPTAGRTLAIFGALSDKDVAGIVMPLVPHVEHWFLGGLDTQTPRGLSSAHLLARVGDTFPAVTFAAANSDISAALGAARHHARSTDRIVAFGSFYVVGTVLAYLRTRE